MHDVKRSSLRRRLRPLAGASVLKYCFLLPAVIWIVAFSIFPLLSAFHYSFANYVLGRGITGYVGFANYINVLGSGTFWYSLFITVRADHRIDMGVGAISMGSRKLDQRSNGHL